MDDLIAWFRSVLDDEEKAARAAAVRGERWQPLGPASSEPAERRTWVVASTATAASVPAAPGGGESAIAAHIARHDPAAVLADVEAKRALLDVYEKRSAEPGGPHREAMVSTLGIAIEALASAYRHTPGWQDSWGA